MKTSRKILVLVVIPVLLVKLISSTRTNNILVSSALNINNKKIINVGVLFYSLDDLFLSNLKQSLEDIGNKNENRVKYTFFEGKNNVAIQNELIDNLLKTNIDLLIIQVASAEESVVEDVINKVNQNNVPIIFLDVPPQVASKLYKEKSKVVFMRGDYKQLPIKEGKIIADIWNNNKQIIDRNNDDTLQYVILQGFSPLATERTKYSISAINDSGIKTQPLSLQIANWDKELAKNAIKSLFLRYNGAIEAIISNNDAMAIGAIEALQDYGYNKGDKSKNIIVVGIDGLPEAKKLIDRGIMAGTVIQDPNVIAEALQTVGINLINGTDPIEGTNYKLDNGEILFPATYYEYINKENI